VNALGTGYYNKRETRRLGPVRGKVGEGGPSNKKLGGKGRNPKKKKRNLEGINILEGGISKIQPYSKGIFLRDGKILTGFRMG